MNRRGFLAGAAAAASALAVADQAQAQQKAPAKPAAAKPTPPKAAPKPAATTTPAAPAVKVEPVNVAVIGLSKQGRALLEALSRAQGANIVAICDTYEPFVKRSGDAFPKAAALSDARQVFDRSDVHAVFIATPTHKHKDLALAAIQAGKAVYCESPLAHTLEDARAIAQAGKASKQVFQVGQQYRANPQHHHVHKFIQAAALGRLTSGRGQWHKKTSWVQGAATDTRQRELNWRLDAAVSPGLVGEVGIHSLDVSNWFFDALPVSVTGFSATLGNWNDGRKVPDTVHTVLEYSSGARFVYEATLTNSFDNTYEVFLGSDAAAMLRDERAWMMREADAPLLGFEIYARKEPVGDEMGICLVADASKQLKEGKIPGKEKPQTADYGKTALLSSVDSFLKCIREKGTPDCGPQQGYEAAVTALKANEAAVKGTKITYQKEWFTL